MSKYPLRTTSLLLVIALASGCVDGDPPELGLDDSALTVPAGYSLMQGSRGGVQCYRKLVAGGSPDQVCAVDMRNSRVRPVHGTPSGALGVQRFTTKVLSTFWNDAAAFDAPGATRILAINASFFGTYQSPTGLSFPYKRDGAVLTYGTDCFNHASSVRNLHLWWDRQYGAIGTYGCSPTEQQQLSAYGSAPDIVGGLATSHDKSKNAWIQRTFVGMHDRNGDGTRETLLIYASAQATQAYAEAQLRAFGAQETMMLDGGGSTGMIFAGNPVIATTRLIPNALVVYTGP